MVDKIDEEHMNDSIDSKIENRSDEIIPNNTETINSIQETENMEIHHHPDLHHKPKKLKEYFLEFIMIFLAVGMGYMAENLRENLVNKEKEVKYVENLVRDLKEEKKSTTEIIKINQEMMTAIDTFVNIRALDFKIQKNNQLFLKLFSEAQLYRVNALTPNEITLNQIKSTGGLNIIRPKIANLIAELDISNINLKRSEIVLSTHTEESFRMIYELVDYPALWSKEGNLKQKDLPMLVVDDKQKLMKYFNLTVDLKYTIDGYVYGLKEHLKLVDNLIEILEEEYNLSN